MRSSPDEEATKDTAAPREVELKLEVAPRSLAGLKRRLAAEAEPCQSETLTSVYYDTPDLRLRKARVTLRLRTEGGSGKRLQTIKAEGAGAGLFDRPEWEQAVTGDVPDLSAAAGTALEPLLTPLVRERLGRAFETRIERTVFSPRGEAAGITVALDHGEIVAGKRKVPIVELELESTAGDLGALFGFARRLGETVPVRLSTRSKAARGYALAKPGQPRAVRATPLQIAADAPAGEAFRLIARSCLHQLVANEAGVVAGDPEALHQMRVGLRRLRAAISVFAEIIRDGEVETVKHELRWLGGRLGPTRDLDVLIADVLAPLCEAHPKEPRLAAFAAEAERRRGEALTGVLAAVRSARFRKAMLMAAAWIEAGPWSTATDEAAAERRGQPIGVYAAQQLRRRLDRILKRGRHIRQLEAAERHEFRIQVKKLRYASEFFSSFTESKKLRKRRDAALDAMRRLQDSLGDLNDIAVREKLAREIVDASGPAKAAARRSFAIGLVLGHEKGRAKPLLEAACLAFDELSDVKRFWEKPG